MPPDEDGNSSNFMLLKIGSFSARETPNGNTELEMIEHHAAALDQEQISIDFVRAIHGDVLAYTKGDELPDCPQ